MKTDQANTDLDRRAVDILRANDRGGFTVPTARLYPYQWNWDSAFAALGFATFDMDRAWREIETLMEGQWKNGMVPHIQFHRDDPDYFPGPSVWRSGTTPPSSGHSQPPVAATIMRDLLAMDPGREDRARALFPRLLAWHRWFHEARDPWGEGVIHATHPWESGRDNSPDWDGAMAGIAPEGVDPYVRRDTSHVDPSMRPTKEEYDRFIHLVQYGRETDWDHGRIAREGPFLVADPGMTFILQRADRDLLHLAERQGSDDDASEIASWIVATEEGIERLWSPEPGGFVAMDRKTGTRAGSLTNASFLYHYAAPSSSELEREAEVLSAFDRMASEVDMMVPSCDPAAAGFDSRRYWRGPVWAMMNYMIGRGLEETGHSGRAARLRADTRRMIERSGFAEYFDPLTGEGCGGGEFTWTAAIWLAWAGPNATGPE